MPKPATEQPGLLQTGSAAPSPAPSCSPLHRRSAEAVACFLTCTTVPLPPLLQLQLRDSQLAGERLQKEYNALAERAGRLHHSLQEHIHSNTQLLADNSQRQVEIKAKEDEIRLLRVRACLPTPLGVGCCQARVGPAYAFF
jgi:hypothetical protein